LAAAVVVVALELAGGDAGDLRAFAYSLSAVEFDGLATILALDDVAPLEPVGRNALSALRASREIKVLDLLATDSVDLVESILNPSVA